MALDASEVSAEDRAYYALLDEKLKREARDSVLGLGQRLTGFDPAAHHVVMAEAIERWLDLDSGLDRLAIFAPPRHAKSFYASWFTPMTILGRHSDANVMHITHSQKFADKMGRRIRNSINDDRKNPWDDMRISSDRSARAEWSTTTGGEYNAFGLDGSPTGNPAEWLLVDDPLKGRKEAFSATERESRWETILSDIWSRLEGPQKQLWLLTRWHEDDPMGRILPEGFDGRSGWYQDRETGSWWYILSLPAVSEHDNDPLGRAVGDWLWPEAHNDSGAIGEARRRANKGGRQASLIWNSLYQQRPSPAEGLFFDVSQVKYYDPIKTLTSDFMRTLTIYGASDYAVTEKDLLAKNEPDYTVHMVFGVDPDWNVYLLALWRGRQNSRKWVDIFLKLVDHWRPVQWAEEDGQIIKSIGPFLKQQQREESAKGKHVSVHRKQYVSSVDKVQRAQSIAGVVEMGRLHVPMPGVVKWVEPLIREMKTFPGGNFDDQCDTLSLFGRHLDWVMHGTPHKPSENSEDMTIDEMWRINESDD